MCQESPAQDLFLTEAAVLGNIDALAKVAYPEDALKDKSAIEWLPPAFAYINVDLGLEYAHLIEIWLAFERSHGWENAHDIRLLYGAMRKEQLGRSPK